MDQVQENIENELKMVKELQERLAKELSHVSHKLESLQHFMPKVEPNGLYQVSRDPLWGAVNRPRQHTFQSMSRSLDQLDGLDSFGDLTGLASHDPDPLGAPSLELAKLHAHDLLPHDPYNPERLFPLNAHVVAFEAFGVGIYTYMKEVARRHKSDSNDLFTAGEIVGHEARGGDKGVLM